MDAIRGNVAIALGNSRDPAAVDALVALLGHSKPQIRAYAAWALGRIGGERACAALESALAAQRSPGVVAEIRAALSSCRN